MGQWNILKQFGVWTTVLRWREPLAFRPRLQGDVLVRLGIALGVGLAATAGLLFLFAINVDPPPAAAALFGLLLGGGVAAALLFHGGGNASGNVRLCEEGIVRTRQSNGLGHMRFEELSWSYEAIGQATIVPNQAIGKSFSLLILSSPGDWEMIGVPRRISLEHLASHFAARGIPVRHADFVPEQFTRGMSWAWAIPLLGLGLPLCAAGMLFYIAKAPAAPANVAALNRPDPLPRFPPPQMPRRGPMIPGAAPPAPPPPPQRPDAEPGGAPQPVNPPPAANENSFGPRGQPGPPDSRPPGFGPRFGPGTGRLSPSSIARGGGERSIDDQPPAVPAPQADAAQRPKPPAAPPRPAETPPPPGAGVAPPEAKKFAPAPPSRTGPPAYNPPSWLPGQPTDLAGGPEGFQFENCDRNRKTVVGFRYRMGRWGNQAAVAQLDPLYDRNQFASAPQRVVGRDGYVVGGVQVVSAELVNAVRIIFVRENADGTLDKTDFYLSDWIGDPGDATPKPLGDGVTRVIGICGRRGAVLNALALVLDKE